MGPTERVGGILVEQPGQTRSRSGSSRVKQGQFGLDLPVFAPRNAGSQPAVREVLVYTRILTLVATSHKILYSVRLEPEQLRLLKAVKARDGVPESEQIRRALMVWFEQKGILK